MRKRYAPALIIFVVSTRCWYKLIRPLNRFTSFLSSCFNGFWLGILARKEIQEAGNFSYSRSSLYSGQEYNRSGLFDWEEKALKKHFYNCKSLLVAGAGGGREVFALRKMGYDAKGFECNRQLVSSANELLRAEGMVPDIIYAPPDSCAKSDKMFEGLIVGWGAYMHIQGRKARIRFLRDMRKRVKEGAPLLISFWSQAHSCRDNFHTCMVVANLIRRLLGRDCVEFGDELGSRGFVHFFTREEISDELRLGGFDLEEYSTERHAHAVGISR